MATLFQCDCCKKTGNFMVKGGVISFDPTEHDRSLHEWGKEVCSECARLIRNYMESLKPPVHDFKTDVINCGG